MRRLLPFLLLLLCSRVCAQEHHRLAGYVQMPGEPLISYYLDITINGTTVTGHSITDYKEGNRLKASVAGRRSPASELYIQETGSLDGPSSRLQAYCYFTAHLKLTVVNGKQRWSGPFESRQENGIPCGSGFMTILDNAPELDVPKLRPAEPKPPPSPPARMRVQVDPPKTVPPPPKPAPPVPKPEPPPPPKDTIKPLPKAEIPKPKPRPVIIIPPKAVPPPEPAPRDSNNCLRTYDWDSDLLSFDIWDGWTIDGDIVSLFIGGRTLLDHAKLSEAKQHFSVPLSRGLNILVISLHEEGFDPPNTPNMTLYDGSKTYDLNISGNPGETARICINRLR